MRSKVQAALGLIIGAGILLLVWTALSGNDNPLRSTTEATYLGQTLSLEVSDDEQERTLGLSGRSGLEESDGMLFVFDSDSRHEIWMRGMKFNIDIIWLDRNKRVVDIAKNATPESYPGSSFAPSAPARYVIELAAGEADRLGIIKNGRFNFDESNTTD